MLSLEGWMLCALIKPYRTSLDRIGKDNYGWILIRLPVSEIPIFSFCRFPPPPSSRGSVWLLPVISLLLANTIFAVLACPIRSKARGLVQHGGPLGWLEEIDPAGCDFVRDGQSMTDRSAYPVLGLLNFELLENPAAVADVLVLNFSHQTFSWAL